MRHSSGLTFIEVMIALFILGVGVIAASSLQGSALSSTRTARTEMELQRQLGRTGTAPAPESPGCSSSPIPTGHTCTVTVVPCRLAGGALTCSDGAGAVVADQITVRAVGPGAKTVELRTVVAR